MENKETLEEFAERLARAFDNDNYKALMELVIDGAKWEQEQEKNKYSEYDMQQYAIFCIRCYEQGLPCIIAQDWFKIYKNK
jgi:hypothetical protein